MASASGWVNCSLSRSSTKSPSTSALPLASRASCRRRTRGTSIIWLRSRRCCSSSLASARARPTAVRPRRAPSTAINSSSSPASRIGNRSSSSSTSSSASSATLMPSCSGTRLSRSTTAPREAGGRARASWLVACSTARGLEPTGLSGSVM